MGNFPDLAFRSFKFFPVRFSIWKSFFFLLLIFARAHVSAIEWSILKKPFIWADMIVSNRITVIHFISKISSKFGTKIPNLSSKIFSYCFFGKNEWELTVRSSDRPAREKRTVKGSSDSSHFNRFNRFWFDLEIHILKSLYVGKLTCPNNRPDKKLTWPKTDLSQNRPDSKLTSPKIDWIQNWPDPKLTLPETDLSQNKMSWTWTTLKSYCRLDRL